MEIKANILHLFSPYNFFNFRDIRFYWLEDASYKICNHENMLDFLIIVLFISFYQFI